MAANLKVLIVDEFSKPAAEVIKTAIRKGFICLEVNRIPFELATTAHDLADHLREFVWDINNAAGINNLKLKECRIVSGEFESLDSTNLTHAGAYYKIRIELPRRVVIGTPLEEVMEEISESQMIINNYQNGECPDCHRLIPRKVTEGQACRNCGHVFYGPMRVALP